MANELDGLVGRSLATVGVRDGETWEFGFADLARLETGKSWRVVAGGRVALCGEDHGRRFGLPAPLDAADEARRLLVGAPIIRAEVHPETGDIVVGFETGARLEVLVLSSGFECWHYGGPIVGLVVCQGGGGLAVWGPETPT